jgi:serine/threonine protein kinase/tetratricopeptide (TPR) repeat protein
MMQAREWQRIQEIFETVTALPQPEREAYLAETCAGDEGVRQEVESLISVRQSADGFFETPAVAEGLKAFLDSGGELMVGHHIGPYKIIREIDRGGMGAIFLAARDDDQYQKRVAIKLIKRGMDTDFILRRFRHERQILANLDHPNIARLIDGGSTEDGRPYFVMEYIEGQRIDLYCDGRGLSIQERLKLFDQVCAAVQYAHQNLVVHRDLKPGNILVTKEGTPKLLDFGIAKLLDQEPGAERTLTALRVLTPEYASPEQIKGEAITSASDLYSLGVMLYQLLTGHPPYRLKSRSNHEVVRAVCDQEPERPSLVVGRAEQDPESIGAPAKVITPEKISELRATQPEKLRRLLSGDLDNIISTALRKEPQRRYQSVAQFAEDIRRHLAGLPVSASRDTLSYRTSKFVKRHKTAVAAAAFVMLTLVGGIIATVWQARVATKERDVARIEKAKAERINRFLQDTLGFADPSWQSPGAGRGMNATVGDALKQASQRAESELADQPEVLAGVLRTTGEAYQNLGQFDLAEHDLRESLDIYRKIYREDNPEVARALHLMADDISLKGERDTSLSLLQQALATYRKHSADGTVPPLWPVEALNDIGLISTTKGEPAAGEQFLREALNLCPQVSGNDRAVVGVVLANLGQARMTQGDFTEAASLYQRSIDEYRRLPGRERLELATSLIFLGEALRLQRKFADSEAALQESLGITGRLTGDVSPNGALVTATLALVLYDKGDYSDAEAAAKRSLRITEQLLPKGHLAFSGPMTTLGLIMNQTGRSAEAESILREALAIRERILPKHYWQIASTESALGECLTMQKRYAEAEPLLRESYDDLRKSLGDQHPRTIKARQLLVQLYQASGNREKLAVLN